MKFVVCIAIALCSSVALGTPQKKGGKAAAPQTSLTVERIDVWRTLADFERRRAEHGAMKDLAELSSVNRALDAAVRPYWTSLGHPELAQVDPNLGALAELTRSLRTTPEPIGETVARSLTARVTPPVALLGRAEPSKVHLKSLYATKWPGPKSLELRITAVSPSGAKLEGKPLRVDPGDALKIDAESELPAIPADAAPGPWKIFVTASEGEAAEAGPWWVVPRSLDAVRAENAKRIQDITQSVLDRRDAGLGVALESVQARNELLSDTPSTENSTQFRLDPVAHAKSVAEEIEKLAQGKDPFQRRPGDLWRVLPVKLEGKPVAIRLYAPAAVAEGTPVPLVFVLGDMSDDENSLLDLRLPRLRQAAEERGFLVVAAAISRKAFGEQRFDTLMFELGDDYPIDSKRVYFLGDCTGAGQLGQMLRPRGDRIAAFLSFGNADVKYDENRIARDVPMLAVAAGLDDVNELEKIKTQVGKARQGTDAIELLPMQSAGWYLLPDLALDQGLEWLFKHTLP
ncbi:MAG: hypothetical protein K8S98_17920 [Planctomycetes bacterium]|nr:hypothetical protein [Planctomycetota bacterium]